MSVLERSSWVVFFGLFLLAAFVAEASAQDSLPSFDSSGPDGQDSQAGRDAPQSPPRDFRTDGRDGGSATRPEKGMDGGNIRLRIFQNDEAAANGRFLVEGTYTDPATGRERSIPRQSLRFDTPGKIRLTAAGGDGGNSAAAGRGQPGAAGEAGRKAFVVDWNPLEPSWRNFRVRAPQRGSRGGHAGDAGNTYDGADAGDGGTIIIEVPQNQSYLLDMIGFSASDVAGGKGGKKGTPVLDANAAKGGEGGEGGTGITKLDVRLEYKLRDVPKNKPQTRSIGLRSSRHTAKVTWRVWELKRDEDGFPIEPRQYVRATHDASYDMPAIVADAPSGERGRDGRGSRNQTLREGRDGREGKREIHVIDESGKTTAVYSSPPRLDIASVSINQEIEDGALMPYESGVLRVSVKNFGGMPSDAGAVKLRVSGSDETFSMETAEIDIPSLKPGETSAVFEVPFTVKDVDFSMVSDAQLRARVRSTVTSDIHVPAIRRDVATRRSEILIELPVSVTSVRGLEELRSGEAAEFEFLVKNMSSLAIQQKSILQALLAYVDGSIPASEVVLVDENNKRIDLESAGLSQEIEKLAAGDSKTIKLKIGIPKTRSAGERFSLRPSVQIGMSGNATETSQVSNHDFTLSVAHSFEFREESDLIVVGSSEGGFRDQILELVADELGLEADVFDLGVEGVFHLFESFPDKIAEIVRGKSIIFAIPNAYYDFTDRIEYQELRDFLLKQSGRLLILNEGSRDDSLVRSLAETLSTQTQSPEAITDRNELVSQLNSQPLTAQGESRTYRPVVRRFWPWQKPKREHFDKEIERTRAAVDLEVPLQALDYIGEYEPGRGRGGFLWFNRKYDLGDIEVTRALDYSDTRVVASSPGRDSYRTAAAIALSLHAEKRLAHFARLMNEADSLTDSTLKAFNDAVYLEWAFELESVFRVKRPDLSNLEKLEFVNLLLGFDFRGVKTERKMQYLSRILGLLSALGGSDVSSQVEEFARENFSESEVNEFLRRTQQSQRDYKGEHGPVARDVAKGEARDAVQALHSTLTSGLIGSDQVLSPSEIDDKVQLLRAQAERYAEAQQRFEQERSQHLLPGGRNGCQQLLDAAASALS